jgi:transposase
MHKGVVFKPNHQHQLSLLPPSLDELISDKHPVRVVNEVLDKIDISILESGYKGGGTSSYHPRMLLKVLVFGYLNNVYSSRGIEKAIQENIHFMWLSGMSRPDHHTINRFRGERLKSCLKDIFTQVVELLMESGHVSLKEVYVDGTKIEANANRYSFVWGNSIKTNKKKMQDQLRELWEYAERVATIEKDDTTPPDFEPTDPTKVNATIQKINKALQDVEGVDKKVKAKLKYAENHWPSSLERYEEQEKILGDRNSYSKTDEDATFMRMKEDHMKNGQLKPAYNVQISTENQFITHFSLHQNPTDTKTLIPHLEEFENNYGHGPEVSTADAGYGSEQNLEYLDSKHIKAYVKYNQFDREQRKLKSDKKPFVVEKLHYDQDQNRYICPMGQSMNHIGSKKERTEAGYVRTIDRYQAQNCSRCPLNGICHKSKGNRIVEVSHRGNELKQQARENLLSEEGIYHRKRRCIEPEPVFANIKHNKNFKRFMLRGLQKVNIEFGLIAIAHNLKKKSA